MMDHSEASETMAAERYVLAEMTPEDREAFEEHFFGCAECAAAVREGATIEAAIRLEKADRTRQPRGAAPLWWLAIAAVAVILVGVPVFQNIGLRAQLEAVRAPHIVDSYSLLSAGSRGGEQLTILDRSRPFTIDFDVPPQPNAQRYVVQVADAAGKLQTSQTVSAEAARDTQHLFFPGGSLGPGTYSLKILAEPAGPQPTTWPFVVR
jgi:hypothetical protein